MNAVFTYILSHQDRYIRAILAHLSIDAVALLICLAIAVPLGCFSAKNPRLALMMQNVTGMIRIIPSIAIFIALMPLVGIGPAPAVIALTFLAIPTILINTMAGIRSVEPMVIETAQAMGMKKFQLFYDIELPLAMPVLLGGIRIAAVEIIAGTTIASYIGAGGLGDFIISGLSQNKYEVMLVGALTVALIAVAVDLFLSLLQSRAFRNLNS